MAFKWSSSENRPTLSQPRQLPHDSLFNQLQCYPELESLHLDFVSCPMHHKGRQLAALTFQQPTCPAEERTRNGIRELCIRLPRTCIRETEAHNSELLTIILRPLNSTNLRKLHLNISVFEDWWDGHDSRGNRITAENPIFEWLNPLTRTWPSLELLKLCVYVEPLLRTEYLTNWDLWASQ